MKFIGPICLFITLSFLSFSNDDDKRNDDDVSPVVPDSLLKDSTALQLIADNPFLETIDSLWTNRFYASFDYVNDTVELNTFGYDKDEVPMFSDSIMNLRMAHLDSLSPISLKYDSEIKRFINLYAVKRRELTSRMMGLSQMYYPMFEEYLDRYNLPLELKHLAIVESALNPRAKSRVGATGLWQFMYTTGKIYDLKVTSYTDDRMDPIKSTIAACEYFTFLYKMFGDWNLVLAAYNSGPGNVNKAIRRSGGKRDYWSIRPWLPRETRGYVPAFIAVNYLMNYTSEHNIYPKVAPVTYAMTDTVHVTDVVTFSQITKVLDVDVEILRFLNPTYKRDIIPFIESSDQNYVLRLPADKIGDFVMNDSLVYDYKVEDPVEELVVEERIVHIVRRGEYLGAIAAKYNCRVSDIRSWNGLRSNSIYPGQKLVVFSSQATANKYNAKSQTASNNNSNSSITASSSENDYIYHTIKTGDTLWDIARKYEGSSVDEIRRLNNIGNAYRLKPGTKIKVTKTS